MYTPGISVVIPTWNEAASIKALIKNVVWAFAQSTTPYEILVVDDHSTDQTVRIVQACAKHYPIQLIHKQGKRGMGHSVLEGYDQASYEYIAILDADGRYSPEYLPQLLALAQTHGFAVANRQGYYGGWVERLVGRFVLGIRSDSFSGLKVFHRNIFAHLDRVLVTAWVIDAPLVYTALEHGYPGGYVNIPYTPRRRDRSLSTILTKLGAKLAGTVQTRFKHSPYHAVTSAVPLGSGVVYRRLRFITHTHLPLELSALRTFAPWQVLLGLGLILLSGLGLVLDPRATLIIATSILSFVYLLDVVFNLYVTLKSLHFPPELNFTPEELTQTRDRDLPLYTILVPLYREAKVLPAFIEAMQALDYPHSKLEILLLLEEDDHETISAARALGLPAHYRILIVPESRPKTKPKACNYGLAHAHGEYIVIYDAEDQPEATQLKKAYLALSRGGSRIGCIQAKLNYYNVSHNLLTRLFTAEYSLWFDVILPGLQSIKTSIPLGGTSNHFKTQVLRDLHGWDPFNVTEDADLGTRLFNAGYQTAIIDSTTLEEANSNLHNWLRQRSRWLKGYMQTYLVHMRHPLTLVRKQGSHALLFNLVVGGKIAFILINPFLWAMTLSYFLLYRYVGPAIESIYPAVVFYMAATSLVLGNFVSLYNYMIGVSKRGHWHLLKFVFLIPFYWLAISYAAVIALVQLLVKPHYWEKTIHGLHLDQLSVRPPTEQSVRAHSRRLQELADLAVSALSSGGVMIVASLFGNLMNFFYNAYLSRRLDLAAFGDISLFGSFLYLSSIPISGLSRTMTHKTAYLLGKYGSPVKDLWLAHRTRLFKLGCTASVLWLIASPLLARFFHVGSLTPFILFAPVWIISTLAAVNGGYLSGNLVFTVLALSAILETTVKFGSAAALVGVGLTHLVYAAVPLSLLAAFGLELWQVSSLKSPRLKRKPAPQELTLSRRFYATSVLTTITSATYLTLDVILAKHFLSPIEAGAYSYLALAGKMVFFLGGMFSQFLIPYVSRDLGAGRSPDRSFLRIFGLVAGVNLLSVLVFGVFGSLTAPILWGAKVSLIVPHLPLYTLAMAGFSLTSLIITYQQLRGRYSFPLVGFLLGALQILGMLLVHSSINSLVIVVFGASLLSLTVILLLSRYYGTALDLTHAVVDFLGLFRPLPTSHTLKSGLLRILIFNWRDQRHVWAGGAEVYLHELSKRWVAMGHQVTLFCGNDGHDLRHERIDGVRVIRRGGFYLVYLWAFLYYLLRLRGRYDVIIDSENGLPFFTPLYAREKVFLLIHHVHQEVFRKSLAPPFSWLALFLERRLMPLVYRRTEVLTVSPSSKADILLHKLTTRDPHVVYNGVDLHTCIPGKKAALPTILYLGRLTTAKSVHVLIHAAQTLVARLPDIRVVIAGDGPGKAALIKLTQKLGLEQVITFTGRVSEPEKIRLYQSAWVFVNPSLIEGWGITTIEANACGTPVVASNVAGLRDAVHNPHSGLLVPYGNVEEFVSKIALILTDTPLRRRMSRESVTWANQFAWDKSATQSIVLLANKQTIV